MDLAKEKEKRYQEEEKRIRKARRKKSKLCPGMRRSEIIYQEYIHELQPKFKHYPVLKFMSFTEIEDDELAQGEEYYSTYGFDTMLCFLAMAYLEAKYDGMTDRLLTKMDDELYFWDLGVGEEMLFEEEKELVYEHLKIVDEYVTKHFKGESRRRELEDDE